MYGGCDSNETCSFEDAMRGMVDLGDELATEAANTTTSIQHDHTPSANTSVVGNIQTNVRTDEIKTQILQIKQELENTARNILHLSECLKNIEADHKNLKELSVEYVPYDNSAVAKQNFLIQKKESLLKEHEAQFGKLKAVDRRCNMIWPHLLKQQAYVCNGLQVPFCANMNSMGQCIRQIAVQIMTCLKYLDYLDKLVLPNENNFAQKFSKSLQIRYEEMAKGLLSFWYVDEFPFQVLKKGNKYNYTVRHLAADSLMIHRNPPFEASVILINEKTARNLEASLLCFAKESGILENNTAPKFNYNDSQQSLTLTWNTRLTDVTHDKASGQTAPTEKFCLLFTALIPVIFPSGRKYQVETKLKSLPVVVITHGKQKSDATATCAWDNATANPIRRPFEVADSIPLGSLLDHLDGIWRRRLKEERGGGGGEVARGLGEADRRFLAGKLFGNEEHVSPQTEVEWRKLRGEKIQGKNFTFWEYFFELLELVSSKHLREYWNRGHINGFIERAECERILETFPTGTFMLRFSQSLFPRKVEQKTENLAAITISCFAINQQGQTQVCHFEPDTYKDLEKKDLSSILEELRATKVVYPTFQPKEHAFRCSVRRSTIGYVSKSLPVTAQG